MDLTIIKLGESVKPVEVKKRTLPDGSEIPYLDDGTVDMGSSWDLFHEASNHDTKLITDQEQKKNRQILRETMERHGFIETPEEWWHYTFRGEPFPDRYFDFVI